MTRSAEAAPAVMTGSAEVAPAAMTRSEEVAPAAMTKSTSAARVVTPSAEARKVEVVKILSPRMDAKIGSSENAQARRLTVSVILNLASVLTSAKLTALHAVESMAHSVLLTPLERLTQTETRTGTASSTLQRALACSTT